MKICQLACVTSKLVNVFVQITQKGMSVKSAKRDSMVPQGMAAIAITCVQPNPSLKVSQTLECLKKTLKKLEKNIRKYFFAISCKNKLK
jgi:hypothetical protein